jgi:spore coat protein H
MNKHMSKSLLLYTVAILGTIAVGLGCGGDGGPGWAEDGGGATEAAGKRVFDESKVHDIKLVVDATDWQAIVAEAAAYENTNPKRPYYRAKVNFDGEDIEGEIGLRLKGHISIQLSKDQSFPLKLDFNRYVKGQTLDGLKKLNLNTNFDGPSLPIMRDYLSYHAWQDFGIAAPRTAFARVSVNGKELGVYVLVEQVDGSFLKRNFDAPRGDLYKPEQETGDLRYRGSSIGDYSDIGHKWPDESNHSSLLNALSVLDKKSGSELAQVFDVKGVLTYMAGNVALGSGDYYPETGHNYYLYEVSPGKFTMLPWDMNGSQESNGPGLCSPRRGLLSNRLFGEPSYEKMYFDLVKQFLDTAGSAASLNKHMDAAVALLGPTLGAEDVKRMREDISRRVEQLKSELESTPKCDAP